MKKVLFPFFLAVLWLLNACNSDDSDITASQAIDSLIVSELDSLGITYTFENGFYRYPITENPGGGSYDDGRIFSVRYKIWVYGGDTLEIKDSINGGPVKMRVGANAIYPLGIDRGLRFVEVGETWSFIVPDSLGFGDFQFDPLIPANSYLQFELTVDQIQNDDQRLGEEVMEIFEYVDDAGLNDTTAFPGEIDLLPSGIVYRTLQSQAGGGLMPTAGSQVTVSYTGSFLDSTTFDIRTGLNNFTYELRSGEVIPGLDEAISQMSEGERALFIIPSGLAYAESAKVIPEITVSGRNTYMRNHVLDPMAPIVPTYASKVGPYRILRFEITLLSVD